MDDEAVTDEAHSRISPIPREARPFQGQRAGIVTRLIAAVLDSLVIGAILLGGYLGLVGLVFLIDPRSFQAPELGLVFSLAAAFGVAVGAGAAPPGWPPCCGPLGGGVPGIWQQIGALQYRLCF